MNLSKIILIILVITSLWGCKKARVERQLPGTWTVVKHRVTDQFGFTDICNGAGTLILDKCKTGNCGYSFNFSSGCPATTYNWQEHGTYEVLDKGNNFTLYRENADGSVDAFSCHIFLITNTDLKMEFYDPVLKVTHLIVFEQ